MKDEYAACLCRLLERFVVTQEKQEEMVVRMAATQDRIAKAQEDAAATQEEWTMGAKLARWADQPDTSSPQLIRAALVWASSPLQDTEARDALIRAVTDYELTFPDATSDALLASAEYQRGRKDAGAEYAATHVKDVAHAIGAAYDRGMADERAASSAPRLVKP